MEIKRGILVMSDKESFNIEEVCEIVGLPSHIIFYWETEFLQLRPERNKSRQRVYSRKDVDVITRIRFLLFEGKHSIQDTQIALVKEFESTKNFSLNQVEKNFAEFGVGVLFWLDTNEKPKRE